MSTKLFVGNLAFKLTDRELRDAFAPHDVIKAEIVRDKYTDNSRGFGFVEISRDGAAAEDAVRAMNGVELGHRPIRVEIAKGNGPNGGARRDAGEHQRFRD